jgi:L-amino acid N-acyltransferase YncA
VLHALLLRMNYRVRAAQVTGAPAITGIYNEGIVDRVGTFETEPRTPEQLPPGVERYDIPRRVSQTAQ